MDKTDRNAIIPSMRFLMLNWRDPSNPLSGGAERVSLAYLTELTRRGHEVCWFANSFPGARTDEAVNGIKLIRGGGKGTSILRAWRWYRRQPPFDLVVDQQHGLPWYAPWWSGTNCVAYIHEVLGPIWNAFYPWPVSSLGQWQESWTLRRYRRIPFWTPSASTERLLTAHGVAEVRVIPNGCDTQPLPELETKPLSRPFRLIAVSRLAPNKRIDHALRVLSVLRARKVDAQLTIVGRGEAEGPLRALAAALGLTAHVTFTGGLSEEAKNQQLRQAHWLVHTSLREGWGLNVIEANAMGTPAIVYPVAGLVDSTVDGITGRIVKAELPEAMAVELDSLLRDPELYQRIRVNAWRRSSEFAWKKILPVAADWLESLASRTAVGSPSEHP